MPSIPDPDPTAWQLQYDEENKLIVVPVEFPVAVGAEVRRSPIEIPWNEDPEFYRARRARMAR